MKRKAIGALQLVRRLILFLAGGAHDCDFDLVAEQVRAIGPGAWVRLITGTQLNGLRDVLAKMRGRSVRARIADGLGGRLQALEQPGASMRARVLQCAVTAGIAGTLVLVTAPGWLGQVRTEAEAAGQVTQYCAPDQNSDAPDSPRVYCRSEHG